MTLSTFCIVEPDGRIIYGGNASSPERAIDFYVRNCLRGKTWQDAENRGVKCLEFKAKM